MIRKKLIAGNWKMNKTFAEAAELAREIVLAVANRPDVDVVICPPFTAIESVAKVVEGSARSEERRVGKECPQLCRSRWSPYH